LGKEGIIAEHPTLKLKYLDPEMARLASELREKLEMEIEEGYNREHHPKNHPDRETNHPNISTTTDHFHEHIEPRRSISQLT
jgi:hypothetical protein